MKRRQETARITEEKVELDSMYWELDRKLQILADRLAEAPEVSITHFQRTAKPGAAMASPGSVQKIKEYERTLVLSDGRDLWRKS